ncbi:hypothetical protein [Legionella nautarum]|nr:hypothetical protein [Legionella nautarum]
MMIPNQCRRLSFAAFQQFPSTLLSKSSSFSTATTTTTTTA